MYQNKKTINPNATFYQDAANIKERGMAMPNLPTLTGQLNNTSSSFCDFDPKIMQNTFCVTTRNSL